MEKKPYTVEDAKAGRKAITRSGIKVPLVVAFPDIQKDLYPLTAYIKPHILRFTASGKLNASPAGEHSIDLFVDEEGVPANTAAPTTSQEVEEVLPDLNSPYTIEDAKAGKKAVTGGGIIVSKVVYFEDVDVDSDCLVGCIDGEIFAFSQEGECSNTSSLDNDLFNVLENRSFWTNIYPSGHSISTYATKKAADKAALRSRVDCIQTFYTIPLLAKPA